MLRTGRSVAQDAPSRIAAALCDPELRFPWRTLVIVAHPDDETIGAGARLHRFAQLHLAHVTDGAPLDHDLAQPELDPPRLQYLRDRRRELLHALAHAGLGEEDLSPLGFVDQESAFRMAEVARAIARLFRERRPELVLTHPYEGGHPDHDTTAFAVQAAAQLVRREGATPPAIVEMAFYSASGEGLVTGHFLPGDTVVAHAQLGEAERERKRRMFGCFVTQAEVLRAFPLDYERFRQAPAYDFLRPPHDGPLHYERERWRLTGAEWRAQCGTAVQALRLPRPPWR